MTDVRYARRRAPVNSRPTAAPRRPTSRGVDVVTTALVTSRGVGGSVAQKPITAIEPAARAPAPAPRRMLLTIAGLAVLLRVATALYLGDTAQPMSGAFDQVSYDALAQRVLAGH